MEDLIQIPKKWTQKKIDLLLNKIFDHLEILLKTEGDRNRVYFSGEFDGSQTFFEKQSNHLRIGVIASNHKVGLILLRLLRIIIDDVYHLLTIYFEELEPGDKYLIKDLVEEMSKEETQYLEVFEIDDIYRTTLMSSKGNISIEKRFWEVDLWNLNRIKETIL